jgi:hypothetical protein
MKPNIDNQILTTKHVLKGCLEYEQKRLGLWGGPDLKSILLETLDNTKKIVEFCRDIELYDDT